MNKTKILTDMFLANLDKGGVLVEDIKKNVESVPNRIYNLVHSTREILSDYSIILTDDRSCYKIIKKDSTQLTSHPSQPTSQVVKGKQEIVIDFLMSRGKDGATIQEIAAATGSTVSASYSLIRNAKRFFKIKSIKPKYYYKGTNEKSPEPHTSHASSAVTNISDKRSVVSNMINEVNNIHFDSQKLTMELLDMAPEDQNDFLDLMKKHLFYGFSAQSLIRANKIINQIRKEVS